MEITWRVYDNAKVAVTGGAANTEIRVRRGADGFLFDFNDTTFKGSGWTTEADTMSEDDATNTAGLYTKSVTESGWDDGYYQLLAAYTADDLGHAEGEILIENGKLVDDNLVDDLNTVATGVVAIETDTQDIQGRIPDALVAGFLKADVKAINASTSAAAIQALALVAIVSGAAAAGTLSTTQMTTDLSEATDNHYNGRVIVWTSGVLNGQATNITDYVGSSGLLTFTGVTEAPSDSDTFVLF